MKKKLIFIVILLSVLRGGVTAQNIYESIGKQAELLTLSNGQFQEFFPNDTLVRIGTVLLNTQTHEIVDFITLEDTAAISAVEADVASRFLSVDPIGREYPELTPYQFASNTPIQAIDLDGLEKYIVVKKKNKEEQLTQIRIYRVSDPITGQLIDNNIKIPHTEDVPKEKKDVLVYYVDANNKRTEDKNHYKDNLDDQELIALEKGMTSTIPKADEKLYVPNKNGKKDDRFIGDEIPNGNFTTTVYDIPFKDEQYLNEQFTLSLDNSYLSSPKLRYSLDRGIKTAHSFHLYGDAAGKHKVYSITGLSTELTEYIVDKLKTLGVPADDIIINNTIPFKTKVPHKGIKSGYIDTRQVPKTLEEQKNE